MRSVIRVSVFLVGLVVGVVTGLRSWHTRIRKPDCTHRMMQRLNSWRASAVGSEKMSNKPETPIHQRRCTWKNHG